MIKRVKNSAIDGVREAALALARSNAKAERSIREIYWFPFTREIRLIEVLPDTIPCDTNRAGAFYFGPVPSENITLPSGIALIRPEEVRVVKPPTGWGRWEDAELVWSRSEKVVPKQ